jgi:hypothetical protein
MDLIHAYLIAGIVVLIVSISIQVKIMQDIHTMTNRTLLVTEATVATAQETLRRLRQP